MHMKAELFYKYLGERKLTVILGNGRWKEKYHVIHIDAINFASFAIVKV